MKTFPYHALSRRYKLGSPRKRILDSGVAALQLGNGVLRAREELGQALWAWDLQFEAQTAADAAILEAFYDDRGRGASPFYWADPVSYLTYPARYDPATPQVIVPHAEVPEHYNADISLLPVVPTATVAMLEAHYKCDDNAANTDVADATGNGHTGTASAHTSTLSVTGKMSRALRLTAASSQRIVAAVTGFDAEEGAVCLWFKINATTGVDQVLFSSADEATDTHYLDVRYDHATGTIAVHQVSGSVGGTVSTVATVSTGTWYHLAIVAGNGAWQIYLNSAAQSLSIAAGTNCGKWFADTADRDNVVLGCLKRTTESLFFNGVLDDVRIYNRPLSALEISALYNSGSGTEEVVIA